MKQFKFVVNINDPETKTILKTTEFKTVEDLCHYLEITKNQYNSIINGRVKFNQYYNKRLKNISIVRKELEKPKRKRQEITESEFIKRLLNKSC